jgi:uncharacterized iron-regulated membrane protein
MLSVAVLGSGVYLWLKKRNISLEARLGALLNEKEKDSA